MSEPTDIRSRRGVQKPKTLRAVLARLVTPPALLEVERLKRENEHLRAMLADRDETIWLAEKDRQRRHLRPLSQRYPLS